MRITMAGIDHTTAPVEVRELCSMTMEALPEVLVGISSAPEIDGCAIVSTCNRTELYLSHAEDTAPDAVGHLCRGLSLDSGRLSGYFVTRTEGDAVRHLMEVAGGLRSSVLADDQILTQVRKAAEAARKAGTADAVLETLFRCAVTAGKRIKTLVAFRKPGQSTALAAVAAVERELCCLNGRKALVIGNGVIGRVAASLLAERGCQVAVTLRNYRHGRPADPPEDCDAVPYEDRYRAMNGRDILISATASPHFTVRVADMRRVASPPFLCVDLAVPRDIEPAVTDLPGTKLWNVDDLKTGDEDENRAEFELAGAIVREESKNFEQWRQNRRRRLRRQPGFPDFPIFINLHGTTVLIAGGGKIGARRADALLGFGARVRVVSPALGPEMKRLRARDGFEWVAREYRPEDLDGVCLAIAATSDREANRRLGEDAREQGVLVSVADRHEECSFYFPAIIQGETLTAGLISRNSDHALVRRAAAAMREEIDRFTADN